jgi:hypothetical protein
LRRHHATKVVVVVVVAVAAIVVVVFSTVHSSVTNVHWNEKVKSQGTNLENNSAEISILHYFSLVPIFLTQFSLSCIGTVILVYINIITVDDNCDIKFIFVVNGLYIKYFSAIMVNKIIFQ